MAKFIRNSSLSIVFVILFLLTFPGQWLTGLHEYSREQNQDGRPAISLLEYSCSGHFIQFTFENLEREFLQMALFIILTISLRQKGSSESKRIEGREEVDREPDPQKKDAPWGCAQGMDLEV